jgi:hypothetical protein
MTDPDTGAWTLDLRPQLTQGCENAPDGTSSERRVARDGDRDLVFCGWHVGEGRSHRTTGQLIVNLAPLVIVDIWVTDTGRIVTAETRWSREREDPHKTAAAVHDDPADALKWLRQRARGRLGSVSKEAWRQACSVVTEFADLETERV